VPTNDLLKNNHFHVERFEDLIERRGWTGVFWEEETKCPCYSNITGNPNYKCPVCGGSGYLYRTNPNVAIKNEVAMYVAPGFIDVQCSLLQFTYDNTKTIARVDRVYNETQNVTYTIVGTTNNRIQISGSPLPVENDVVKVDYVYERDPNVPMKAIMTNVDYQNNFIPTGEWLQGDVIITISDAYWLGVRDRITIKDSMLRTTDLLRRYEVDVYGNSREKLLYDKNQGIEVIMCRDKYNVFTEDTDFRVEANGEINWSFIGASGNRPQHKCFTIVYTGAGTTAIMTISGLNLVTVVDGTPDLNLSFNSYPTVQELVDYINENCPDYTATISPDAKEIDDQSAVSEATNKLVGTAGVDIKTPYQVYGEDKTQYSIEFMHYAIYSIWQQVGATRHHDNGATLPHKYWLRLWEKTRRT